MNLVRPLFLLLSLLIFSCKDHCNLDDLVDSSCVDANGNTYKTVLFPNGSEWMAENLKAASISSTNSTLSEAIGDSLWNLNEAPYYCYYDNYSPNETGYGKLYNFKAVNTEGLCPEGFHVPTTEDWEELFECLGGPNKAGAKLREVETNYWNPVDNITSTNESRLTIRPGGFREQEGEFHNQRFFGYYWSSKGENESAQMVSVHYASDAVTVFEISNASGASVRCMR